jgi:hypothetical protein
MTPVCARARHAKVETATCESGSLHSHPLLYVRGGRGLFAGAEVHQIPPHGFIIRTFVTGADPDQARARRKPQQPMRVTGVTLGHYATKITGWPITAGIAETWGNEVWRGRMRRQLERALIAILPVT